jgi:tetratricopeptide (TPR) repeat protein
MDPGSSSSELSDLYYTTALYKLRTLQGGAGDEYKRALALNHSNVDALGGYAQWLFTNKHPNEADTFFREAIRLDRQSLSRYAAYAEFLGTIEEMDKLRELGGEIAARFPNARGYLALARLYELTGELDIGIAWGLKAVRLQQLQPKKQPRSEQEEAPWQVAELFSRIGDFGTAARYDPDASVGRLWFEQRYRDLIDLAQERILEFPDDVSAKYHLAFAYNAIGDFKTAIYLLKQMGMPLPQEADPGDGTLPKALASYVDALQSLGGNESLVAQMAAERIAHDRQLIAAGMAKSWYVNSLFACSEAQLGNYSDALDLLERAVSAQGLVWSPLVQDSPCFKRLAEEPRYKAAIDHLEERKKQLRERLPATLKEYGVADVMPAHTK